MKLMKYSAPRQIGVDRLASEIFGPSIAQFFGSDGFQDHAPRVNIVERADDFKLEVLAPGFDRKDLKVDLEDDTLTVRGEHTVEGHNDNGRYTRREFERSSFKRSFLMPQGVKADGIKAEHLNGVLTVIIPKTAESKPQTRTISIS